MNATRRDFLKASAVFAAPLIIPSRCFGANERVSLGYIGVRNRGPQNLDGFHKVGGTDTVAFADVDSDVLTEALGKAKRRGLEGVDTHADYRELLDRSDIDAVVVSTPDHWHALQTVDAARAGKDVYCEKPLTLCVSEGPKMVAAIRENDRVCQTGSQQRSGGEFIRAATLVRNGAIGNVSKVLVGVPKTNHPGPIEVTGKPPQNLDYERWIGPAPMVPYAEKRVHYNFRFWWDYSGGQMTNFGAHHLDIARWGLGLDDRLPTAAKGDATFHSDRVHEVTETFRITQRYDSGPVSPEGVSILCGQLQDDCPAGITFIGSEGRIHVNRGHFKSDPPELKTTDLDAANVHLTDSTDHYGNFIECVKTRDTPVADVQIGAMSAAACHINNVVARLGRPVTFDPDTMTLADSPEGNRILDRPYREGYSLG